MAKLTGCNHCRQLYEQGTTCKCGGYKRKSKSTAELSEVDRLRRSYTWQKKAKYIKKRDGHLCQRCKANGYITNTQLEVHHIKSAINHIELFFVDSNLVTVCRTCNMQLGTKDMLDFSWSPPEIEYHL